MLQSFMPFQTSVQVKRPRVQDVVDVAGGAEEDKVAAVGP